MVRDFGNVAVTDFGRFIRKGLSKGGKVRAARQAAAEIGMLRMLRLPLASVCNVTEHDPAVLRLLLECKFRPDSPKQWASAISFPDKEAEEALVYVFRQIGNLGEAEKSAESGATEPKTAKKSRPNDPRHQLGKSVKVMNLSLEDPAVKFAVRPLTPACGG